MLKKTRFYLLEPKSDLLRDFIASPYYLREI